MPTNEVENFNPFFIFINYPSTDIFDIRLNETKGYVQKYIKMVEGFTFFVPALT